MDLALWDSCCPRLIFEFIFYDMAYDILRIMTYDILRIMTYDILN